MSAEHAFGTSTADTQPPPVLHEVLVALYRSEINASVTAASFWDDGWYWTIRLGDELNGFKAEKVFRAENVGKEGPPWLIREAVKNYPRSVFAQQDARQLLEKAVVQERPMSDTSDDSTDVIVRAAALCEEIERYGFECQGGPLRNCLPWKELRRLLNHSQTASPPPTAT